MRHNLSISEILAGAGNIAIIGASSKAYRTSHHIMQYLMDQNYRVIPVNPNEETVMNYKCYDSVLDIPADVTIDIMVIFRNKEYSGEMVRDIVQWSKKTSQRPAIWTQLDVSSPEAESIAEEEELPYIKNRCIMVEHRAVN
jgi:predicted CoA-binding protein